jgi:hypothetical protein
MKKLVTATLAGLALASALVAAQGRMARTLDIYLIDVEGGNATLFVSPSGTSMLIDTGNGGMAANRDADRILAAALFAARRSGAHRRRAVHCERRRRSGAGHADRTDRAAGAGCGRDAPAGPQRSGVLDQGVGA